MMELSAPTAPPLDEARSTPRLPALVARFVRSNLLTLLAGSKVFAADRPLGSVRFRMRGRPGETDWSEPLTPVQSAAPPWRDLLEALLVLTIPEDANGSLTAAAWRAADAEGAWTIDDPPSEDFVFRYPIIQPRERPAYRAAYAAEHLSTLLDLVDLAMDEDLVLPDHVTVGPHRAAIPPTRIRNEVDLGGRFQPKPHGAERQPLQSIAATEPFIVTLAELWGLLASQIQLFADGADGVPVVRGVTGFRLRRTADWTVASGGHPSEVYEYLARVCNVTCSFCYLHGNPDGLAVARGAAVISRSEMNTRMRHYDPAAGVSLFTAQWEINEFLVDPKIHEVLPQLRAATGDAFYFITNGNPLKGRVLDLLEAVKPVHLVVSVNTLDENLRTAVMGERQSQTQTALKSLQELVARRIPFGLSLAAFPDFTLADMERTIRLAEGLPAAFVRINLPGFTRKLPYEGALDTEQRWAEVRAFVAELRRSVSIPLITIPSAYDEAVYDDPLAARVIGATPGSPADKAGLRPYDMITAINDFEVQSRADLFSLLLLLRGEVRIAFLRDGQAQETVLDLGSPGVFPYDGPVMGKYVFPGGIVAAPALSPRIGDEMTAMADRRQAENVWILTSPIMESTAARFIERYVPGLADRATLLPVTNEFLGGNIAVMDMGTVSDIVAAVESRLRTAPRPDLILLADTGFNGRGRDLEGRHWGDLERLQGVPVEMFDVTRFLY